MENQNEIMNINAIAIAYDPNAPMADAPMIMIGGDNVEVLPPNDDEIQIVKDLEEVEEFIGLLFDEGEISDYAYTELGGLFNLIKDNKWYKKIERRMEAGGRRERERMSAMEKLNDPTRVTCPDCLERVKNLKDHQGRPCCVKHSIKMKLKATKKQLVNETILAASLDLNDTIERIENYKKQINNLQEELEEEEYEMATIEDDTEDDEN
jgi:hypothetical protein